MKKEYKTPLAEILHCTLQPLMEASGVSSEERGIGYGGVDEEGSGDPESRQLYDPYQVWGEE